MVPRKIGIYKICCTVNNKVYVGSSINLCKRWLNHRYELNHNKHHSPYLQNAWNKYGQDAFVFEILEELQSNLDIIIKEQYWMDHYKSYNTEYGFNVNSRAEGNHARKWTDAQRIKYSNSRKGKKASPELLKSLNNCRLVGSKSNLSSIDEDKVLLIIKAINEGLTPNEVCKLYSVGIALVRSIYLKKTWKHVSKDIPIRKIGRNSQRQQIAKLNEESVKIIKKRLAEGESHLFLAKEFNVNWKTLLDIKQNKTWKDIKI